VEIKGAYYSVPPEFLGQRLWARWDGRTVRLLDQKMRPIAVHVQRPPGTFSTLPVHIVPEKISGIERGTTWLLRRSNISARTPRLGAVDAPESRHRRGARADGPVVAGESAFTPDRSNRPARSRRAMGRITCAACGNSSNIRTPVPSATSFEFIQQHPIIRDLGDYGQFVRQAITQQLRLCLPHNPHRSLP
jgi:hypothetical protein